MILSTADPNQVISIRSIFPVLRIQVSNAHTEFNRQMPSQWTHVSISYSCSCVILPPVSLLLFQLKIIGTSFGICSQEVSGQSSARMAVSQPVTRLCPSRKELIAEITSAVRPPRAFVLNIQTTSFPMAAPLLCSEPRPGRKANYFLTPAPFYKYGYGILPTYSALLPAPTSCKKGVAKRHI